MIGQFLGHYRIDAQLGAGAMGVVYRAYDTRLHRMVAIKQLQDTSSEVSGPRLLEEARAAATLNHPSICTIHEVAEIDGHAFIVMEYVDGKALSDLIPPTGLSVQTVLEYGSQIADAVAFAHAGGIVHRDLKSSNILITRDGRPKILDFGLARRIAGRSVYELSESVATVAETNFDIAGTPQYMSPEALRGESSSARSDVWSLGIVLYEMATGHRPYDERTPYQLAARVLSDTPVEVPPSIAPQLAAVIKRCLAKQPERRYAQAGEVRAALEAVQLTAFGMQPMPAVRRLPLRRSSIVAMAIAAGIVFALALGVEPLRNALGRVVSEPAIAFAERDWLLVSDFANHTGDPVFDRSLNTALSAALTQSRYVNIVPSSRIRESLRRMERSDLTRADEAAAREIALREGFRLVLAPAITSTGGSYLLAAAIIDPTTGATLKSESARVDTKSGVLAAVDELSTKIRGELGEASAMIAGQAKPLVKATTGSLEALQHFSLGREAHIGQQLEKARTLYEEALRIDPSFTAARASLGILNFEFFDRAKGIELLSQALKAVDGLNDNERVSVLGFHALAVEKDLEKGANHYKTFLALHPDVASAHNNLGRIYMQMRRFKDAIAELQETIRLDPDLFLAYFSLNTVYLYEVADLDSAIEVAQRQIARNARAARAYGQLGAAYAGKGDLRQAEDAFRKAIELDARFVIDQYRLGHVLRLQGRFDEARQIYLHIREIAANEISASYEAGAVSQLMGDEAAARTYLQQVIAESERSLQKNPRDGTRQLELASAWARLGNRTRAEAIARQAETLTANLPVERAGLQVLLGEPDDALTTLERAVQNGYRNIVWVRINTDLHALQGNPRLHDLIAEMR
jgi:tetratricopeptide (TPR) repeat protein/tRNA A-37 threonylcarbamoyl transferase component Bud32